MWPMTNYKTPSYFQDLLSTVDPEIFKLIQAETDRQEYGLEMIPSENFVSEAVLEACGSVCTNKYAEGLPAKRYYGGCEVVDKIETIAQQRTCKLFGAEFANVQPHSGATANQAIFEAFLKPGDTVMGMRLDQGGHLTHGSPVNFSGKHYKVVAYGVGETDHLINMDEVRSIALANKPRMIIAGASAYSRVIDFKAFGEIAKEIGAIFMADIAHYAGLVAAGVYPNPTPFADVVSTTTHKTLRGPRSGMFFGLEKHAKDLNKSVFPGLQGGPHMHTIAAKAVALKEAMEPAFKDYAKQVIKNAQTLCIELTKLGLTIVSGGTDSHVFIVDLRPAGVTGKEAQAAVDAVHITANKNTIPNDPQPPMVCSGLRMGSPALTTRGMKEEEMKIVAKLIVRAIESKDDAQKLAVVRDEVKDLSSKFPLYRHKLVSYT